MTRRAILKKTAIALAIFAMPLSALAEDMSAEAVLQHHLEAFGSKDLDAVMSDYTEDTMLIWDGEVHKGLDALRKVYAGAMDEMTADGVRFEMEKMLSEGRVALLKWNADTATNRYIMGTDTYIIEDGKIAVQTVTFRTEPVQ